MKKILKYILILTVLSVFSCTQVQEFDNLAPAKYEYIGVVKQTVPDKIFEGTGVSTMTNIDVLHNVVSSGDVQVTFSPTSESTALLGTHFNVPGAAVQGESFTLTVPTDTVRSFFTIETVSNTEEGTDLLLSYEITNVSGGVQGGQPLGAKLEITILDDDCPYGFDNFVGTASVIENGSVGPYNVTTTEVAPNTINIDNFWDEGIPMDIILVPCDGSVIINASTPAFGDPDGNVVGTGTWDDTNNIIVMDITISFPRYDFVSIEQHVYTF